MSGSNNNILKPETHRLVLNLVDRQMGVVANANVSHGIVIYTFPASDNIIRIVSAKMLIRLTNTTGVVNADTPEVGVGTTSASAGAGNLQVLNGTAATINVIAQQVAPDVTGGDISGFDIRGLSLTPLTANRSLHLNIADGWAGNDTVIANGQVIVDYYIM